MERKCVICNSVFNISPSSNKVTCGDACRKERARRSRIGKTTAWNEESKAALSERGVTDNLRKGTLAAQASPIAGPFETNKEALIWTIKSPEGVTYNVRNLNKWLRDHAEMLPGTPEQARAGFMQIKRSMQGKTKRAVSSWKGWALLSWEYPPEHKKSAVQ